MLHNILKIITNYLA